MAKTDSIVWFHTPFKGQLGIHVDNIRGVTEHTVETLNGTVYKIDPKKWHKHLTRIRVKSSGLFLS